MAFLRSYIVLSVLELNMSFTLGTLSIINLENTGLNPAVQDPRPQTRPWAGDLYSLSAHFSCQQFHIKSRDARQEVQAKTRAPHLSYIPSLATLFHVKPQYFLVMRSYIPHLLGRTMAAEIQIVLLIIERLPFS